MIQPHAYYTVQGWMREELGLSGNALAIYAIIYGFSQDGASEYAGSSRYLAEWLGCSKKTVLNTLADLTEKGYLVKKTINQNGVTFCNYVTTRPLINGSAEGGEEITPPGKNFPQGGEEITPGAGKNFPQGGEKITPHNTRDISIYNSSNNIIPQNAGETPPTPTHAPKATTEEINKFFDSVWKLYPVKKGKADVSEKKRRELYKIGYDGIKRAVDRYLQDLAKDADWRKPKHGSTFFNSGYVDYLDENYEPDETPTPQARPSGCGVLVGPNGIKIDQSKNDLDALF